MVIKNSTFLQPQSYNARASERESDTEENKRMK